MSRLTTSKRRAGFTLIELMITVAIIGILATIAIPAFINYQNKSRRSEAFANLSAIVKLEKSYYGSYDVYADTYSGGAASWPGPMAGTLGPSKRSWTTAAQNAFAEIGFNPEGSVFYDYEVNTGMNCASKECFTATAYGDVDGDSQLSVVQYVQPSPDGSTLEGTSITVMGLTSYPFEPVTGRIREREVAVNYSADEF